MSGYTLTYKDKAAFPLTDGSMLRPDTLSKLNASALAAVKLKCGREQMSLGDLFAIAPGGTPGQSLTLRNAPRLDRLGSSMASGRLTIEGDAGDDLGASMAGGLIHVRGCAGARAGGPAVTSDCGMTGGEIIIDQTAGDYLGLRMRRGLIVAGEVVGLSPGYRMMAGTMVIGCGPVDLPGLEMRRGTIIYLGDPDKLSLGDGFDQVGRFDVSEWPVLRLIGRRLGELAVAGAELLQTGQFCLFTGDRHELNRGEVWVKWQ